EQRVRREADLKLAIFRHAKHGAAVVERRPRPRGGHVPVNEDFVSLMDLALKLAEAIGSFLEDQEQFLRPSVPKIPELDIELGDFARLDKSRLLADRSLEHRPVDARLKRDF